MSRQAPDVSDLLRANLRDELERGGFQDVDGALTELDRVTEHYSARLRETAGPKVGPLENRAVWTLLLFLGVAGIVLTALLLWQFRDAFTPIGLLAGGAWVFQRTVLRRQS